MNGVPKLTRALIPPRSDREELIDGFDRPGSEFDQTYGDLRRINRFLGGVAVVRRRLGKRIFADATALDVATGSGDVPEALRAWASSQGVRLWTVGVDANPHALDLAQRLQPEASWVKGDARRLPFQDGAFDFVVCSLTFHHFDDATAAETLREMHRVARRAVIVNDLRRGYLPAALIWLVSRVTRMHAFTRHDSWVSVLKSRTMDEYRELARGAGFPDAEVHRHAFWRAAIVVTK